MPYYVWTLSYNWFDFTIVTLLQIYVLVLFYLNVSDALCFSAYSSDYSVCLSVQILKPDF